MEVALDVARWILLPVAAFWFLGTLVAETRLPQYWVRMWDFPRAQIAVFALITTALYLAAALPCGLSWIDWTVLVAGLFTVAWQCKWIVPYTPIGPREMLEAADDAPRLTIVITNVLQQNEQHDRWREVIAREDADLIACAEVDDTWADVVRGALAEDYPHHEFVTQDNMYGMALLSRRELLDVKVERLVQQDVPSIHAAFELAGDRVNVHVLHPKPPAPQEGDSAAPRDAELILMGRDIEERRDEGRRTPTLVMGDLNDVAWSRTTQLFRKISGLLDPRKGRGLVNSFHAEHWWFRFPLDHIFASDEFRLVEIQRLDYVGSDHFPVRVVLSYEPDRRDEQREDEPSEAEVESAEARLEIEREREAQGKEDGHLREHGVEPGRTDPERES